MRFSRDDFDARIIPELDARAYNKPEQVNRLWNTFSKMWEPKLDNTMALEWFCASLVTLSDLRKLRRMTLTEKDVYKREDLFLQTLQVLSNFNSVITHKAAKFIPTSFNNRNTSEPISQHGQVFPDNPYSQSTQVLSIMAGIFTEHRKKRLRKVSTYDLLKSTILGSDHFDQKHLRMFVENSTHKNIMLMSAMSSGSLIAELICSLKQSEGLLHEPFCSGVLFVSGVEEKGYVMQGRHEATQILLVDDASYNYGESRPMSLMRSVARIKYPNANIFPPKIN